MSGGIRNKKERAQKTPVTFKLDSQTFQIKGGAFYLRDLRDVKCATWNIGVDPSSAFKA